MTVNVNLSVFRCVVSRSVDDSQELSTRSMKMAAELSSETVVLICQI